MEWPTTQELGVGGTLALAALALTLRTIFQYRRRNGNGHKQGEHEKSGDLNPAEWEARIERIIEKAIDDKFKIVAMEREKEVERMVEEVIKNVFARRTEELRLLFREELQYFYGLKGSIRRRG